MYALSGSSKGQWARRPQSSAGLTGAGIYTRSWFLSAGLLRQPPPAVVDVDIQCPGLPVPRRFVHSCWPVPRQPVVARLCRSGSSAVVGCRSSCSGRRCWSCHRCSSPVVRTRTRFEGDQRRLLLAQEPRELPACQQAVDKFFAAVRYHGDLDYILCEVDPDRC